MCNGCSCNLLHSNTIYCTMALNSSAYRYLFMQEFSCLLNSFSEGHFLCFLNCCLSSTFIPITNFYFRELLTPQQHYDWGLRALKTVLKGCGNLLQAKKKGQGNNSQALSAVAMANSVNQRFAVIFAVILFQQLWTWRSVDSVAS